MSNVQFINLFLSILARPKKPNPLIQQQALEGLRDAAEVIRRFAT